MPKVDLPIPSIRARRNRVTDAVRRMVRETFLSPSDFILPLFIMEGDDAKSPIASMPGISRLGKNPLLREAREAFELGIPAVALFPLVPDQKKDKRGSESLNPDGLFLRSVKTLKDALPDLCIVTDVAMDPYSSDGHDGYVENGKIVNDITLEILGEMAVAQAAAGADIIAPSDMMDGRVGAIRAALDASGFLDTQILAYAAKYASAFYGPFRDAVGSRGLLKGDKKTYQMDPANAEEALREVELDLFEGADSVMVKPGLPYLDIIVKVKEAFAVPVFAYQVSGEYAMIEAAVAAGAGERDALVLETLTAFKRAGCSGVLTYHAAHAARLLNG